MVSIISWLGFLFPKVGLGLIWGAIAEMLVEFGLVPPRHSLERRGFYFDNVGPRLGMDQLIFIGTVDVFLLGHCPTGRQQFQWKQQFHA